MKRKLDRTWIIALASIGVGLLIGFVVGYQIIPGLSPAAVSDLSADRQDEYVTLIALGFVQTQNLEQARNQLAELEAPNAGQLVASVAEQQIGNNGNPQAIVALAGLASALGVQNNRLSVYLATPTPVPPTATAIPTASPTPTLPEPTATDVPPTLAPPTPTAEPPTITPEPTSISTPLPAATRPPAATQPPVPPTATAVPQSTTPFTVTNVRLRGPGEASQSCAGGDHYVWVTVLDAAGNPIDGVRVQDAWTQQVFVTGAQGKGPGRAEVLIWQDGGTALQVVDDNNSPISPKGPEMPSNLPPWELFQPAGYCDCKPYTDVASCQAGWQSRDFRYFPNSHYVYEITFQRTN